MHDVPDGLTPAELRHHPIACQLAVAAFGDEPTEADLDALKLPPDVRRRVATACRHAATIRAEGEFQRAREHAREQAAQIIDALPPEHRRPDYLRVDTTPDDPAELAAMVGRR